MMVSREQACSVTSGRGGLNRGGVHRIIEVMVSRRYLLLLLALASLPSVVQAQELTEVRRIAVAQRLQESSVSVEIGRGQGSGFLVGEERWVVTNAHVIQSAGRGPIRVRLGSGEVVAGRVIAVRATHDLAVVELSERPEVPGLPLGDSDRVAVGQAVLAFGSPFGLQGTLTQGIVSARRDFPIGRHNLRGAIQTDAPINPGNSGGPLVNARGQVIGVNTAILSRTGGSNGIGFAVPSNYVRDLIRELRAHPRGRVPQPADLGSRARRGPPAGLPPTGAAGVWLGIYGEDYTQEPFQGVRIRNVIAGSPAERAGLRGANDRPPAVVRRHRVRWTGHIILAVDGHRVQSMRQLHAHLRRRQAGESATLFVTVGPGVLNGEMRIELQAAPPGRPDPGRAEPQDHRDDHDHLEP